MNDLPGYLQERPKHKYDWARPTTWLLGSKLAGRLKQLLLVQIHRGFDIRDWMAARSPPSRHDGTKPYTDPTSTPSGDVASNEQQTEPYWIDYVSDTGDVQRLVYQLAYLLQQDVLTIEDTKTKLPRGAVLVIGGDAAYPVADEDLLNERLRAPFRWAWDRIEAEKEARERIEAEKTKARKSLEADENTLAGLKADEKLQEAPKPVRLFGVPANHDYYDMLNGFARQFREPCTGEGKPADKDGRLPLLALNGYERTQQASYFALELPFGWHLWGIDAQDGLSKKDWLGKETDGLDTRQVQYFRSIQQPEKLIVASAQPVIVYRTPIDECHIIDKAYRQLGLPRVYRGVDKPLEAGQARIDLSGNIHVYERYYGAECRGAKPSTPERGAETKPNYAAVVCGLGGVFNHPGQVRFGNVAERAAWPPETKSVRAISEKLMRPRMVFHAGSGGILGAAFATLFWLLATVADSTPSALHLPWLIAVDSGWPAVLGALGRTFLYLCCVGVWCAAIWSAYWWRRRVQEAMQQAPADWCLPSRCLYSVIRWPPVHVVLWFCGGDQRNAHAFLVATLPRIIVVVGGLLCLVWLATLDWFAFGGAHTAANIVVLLFLSLMLVLGWIGRKHLGVGATAIIFVLAFIHGGLQIVTPLLWTPFLLDNPLYVAVLLGCFVLPYVLQPLLRRDKGPRQIGFLVLWLVLAAVFVTLPLLNGVARPVSAWPDVIVAAGTGAFFACLWLGWYFLVSLQWNAHGNEAASVARVDRYAAFLRIKLTEKGAEVWAIQADETQERNELGECKIVARLIDHFRVDVAGTSPGSSGR